MKQRVQFAIAVWALALGLGTVVLYGQLWTASGSGVSTSGTMTVTGATTLNGGLTMDTSAFTVANTTGNVATTGTVTVTNAGPHSFSTGAAGEVSLRVRNTTNGAGAFTTFYVGNDASALQNALVATSTSFTPSGQNLADALIVQSSGAGGISLAAINGAGDIRFYTGGANLRTTIDDAGNISHTGRYHSATLQPGFWVFNNSGGTVTSTSIVPFDAEVYDTNTAFTSNTYTVPAAGIYHFCAGVTAIPTDGSTATLQILIRLNGSSTIARVATTTQTVTWTQSYYACSPFMSMAANDLVTVINNSGESIDVVADQTRTWFSGRLVP